MLKFPSVSSVRHRYNIPNEVSILTRIRVTPNFEAKEGGGGGGGWGGLLWVQFSIGGASDFYYIIAHFL